VNQVSPTIGLATGANDWKPCLVVVDNDPGTLRAMAPPGPMHVLLRANNGTASVSHIGDAQFSHTKEQNR
jgi:hypothetical protein